MHHPSGTHAARPPVAGIADYGLPTAILLAVLVVLAPVPPAIVDLLLAANLTVSVLALLGAVAARTPLELSVFPTFLLGSTLVRLVLNIATTRLILSRAAIDGADAAGLVVSAFGDYVAANHLVVGGVIFAIIAVVQFVVITAGATRTSEVAARFALDGLPGRQMAIDTEVQAGTITREQARGLRLDLQRQADFFASMDGASRFVRGEAVAGVVITLVNLVGGLAIGVLEHGMPLGQAAEVYSRLTIGDGLTSAVPALLVSVATGLLISRSSQEVDLPREFSRQFTARPHVLAVTGVFLALLSLTDLPFLPLAALAAAMFAGAFWLRGDRAERRATSGRARTAAAAVPAPAETLFADERIVVVLGPGLVRLVSRQAPLLESVADLRRSIAADLGFLVPTVAFRDDVRLPERRYRVLVGGEPVVEGEMPAGRLLAVPRAGERLEVSGDVVHEEASGSLVSSASLWVSHAQAETLRRRDVVILDEAATLARILEAALRRYADRLVSREDTVRLVETLRATQPGLVEEVVPRVLPIAKIHRALQALLAEGVPIRPLSELLEIMADHSAETAEPWQLAEVVRRRLAGSICRRARDPDGRLTAVRLTGAALEACVAAAASGRPPARLVAEVRRAVRVAVERGGAPAVVVPAEARRQVRAALARPLPNVSVFAEEEVAHEPHLEMFTTLAGAEALRAA
ncbi:MAG: flagellar biosynthesis protein FlhA [Planctomycetaceae bacterium]